MYSGRNALVVFSASLSSVALYALYTKSNCSSKSSLLSDLEEIISSRRSVFPKQFTGRDVKDSDLKKCLEAGVWAPNHHLTEPWKFVVYKGKEKERLGRFLADMYKLNAGGKFNRGKYDKKIANAGVSSHIVGIVVRRGGKGKKSAPEVEDVCSVAMAVQNVGLMACEMGVGMYWSSASIFKEGTKGDRAVTNPTEVREELGLEGGEFCIGWLFVGDGKTKGKGRRTPLGEGGGLEWRE